MGTSGTEETLNELSALLRQLPGVAVESTDSRVANHICVVLTIEQLESIGPIAYCAQGANMALDVLTVAPPRPYSEHANPAHLRYRLSAASSQADGKEARQTIQLFGIFLVWYLHRTGAIIGSEANRHLAAWGGKRVAA